MAVDFTEEADTVKQGAKNFARARGILVVLALGSVTAVGVAWLISDTQVFKVEPVVAPRFTSRGALQVHALVSRSPASEHRTISTSTVATPRRGQMPTVFPRDQWMSSDSTWRKDAMRGRSFALWIERGYGFPFVCLFKWQNEGAPLQGAIELPDPLGISQHWPGQPTRGFPYLPIWPGLIANSVFWGGAWWCVLFLPPIIRRRHRIRQGQCPACGYDRAGLTAESDCPECGVTATPGTRLR